MSKRSKKFRGFFEKHVEESERAKEETVNNETPEKLSGAKYRALYPVNIRETPNITAKNVCGSIEIGDEIVVVEEVPGDFTTFGKTEEGYVVLVSNGTSYFEKID